MFGDCRVSFQVSNISKSQEPSGRGYPAPAAFFALRSSPSASPSSVTACGGATFPREGEGFGHWHLHDCTVVSVGAAISLPPLAGEGGWPQARRTRGNPPQKN